MPEETGRQKLPTLQELEDFARAPSRGDGGAHYRQIQQRLARHPIDGKAVLEQLLRSRDVDTRAWAAITGTAVYGQHFEPTLVRLFNDGSGDMQSLAVALLQDLGPAALKAQLPVLRRRLLRLEDEDDIVQVMWVLARLRDVGALPAVNSLASRPEPYVRKMASVLADYLEGGEDRVLRRLASHDHEHTVALCRLAWHLGSEHALSAMRACAESGSDAECRNTCMRFARSLESRRAQAEPPFWGVSAPE